MAALDEGGPGRKQRSDAVTAELFSQLDTISSAVSALRSQMASSVGHAWARKHTASISDALRTFEQTLADGGTPAAHQTAPAHQAHVDATRPILTAAERYVSVAEQYGYPEHALLTTLRGLSSGQDADREGWEEYLELNNLFQEDLSTLPEELTLVDPVLHLVLCVHGIGLHRDFIIGEKESDGGGYNTTMRSLLKSLHTGALTALRACFDREKKRFGLDFQVEFSPIEWHSSLHDGCNLDELFGVSQIRRPTAHSSVGSGRIMPKGISGVRDFSQTTVSIAPIPTSDLTTGDGHPVLYVPTVRSHHQASCHQAAESTIPRVHASSPGAQVHPPQQTPRHTENAAGAGARLCLCLGIRSGQLSFMIFYPRSTTCHSLILR